MMGKMNNRCFVVLALLVVSCVLILAACKNAHVPDTTDKTPQSTGVPNTNEAPTTGEVSTPDSTPETEENGVKTEITYEQITGEQAKALMDSETGYVILDVRTELEFAGGHIEGAILIPDYEITTRAEEVLKDKNQLILVYCRSGNRSKTASQALADMGYTNVKEFGGINDWQYGTVK